LTTRSTVAAPDSASRFLEQCGDAADDGDDTAEQHDRQARSDGRAGDETVGVVGDVGKIEDGDDRDRDTDDAGDHRRDQLATEANDQQTDGDQHNAEQHQQHTVVTMLESVVADLLSTDLARRPRLDRTDDGQYSPGGDRQTERRHGRRCGRPSSARACAYGRCAGLVRCRCSIIRRYRIEA